jgi:hypothetical protein
VTTFFINAGGLNIAPFDTPEKGALNLFSFAYDYQYLVGPDDVFEIVDNGTIIEPCLVPFEIQRGSIIRSWSENKNKPTIQIPKTSVIFHSGKVLNIKFFKDGNIVIPGPAAGHFFASIYKDVNQEVSGCEFKFINAPTNFMYVIEQPVLQYGGNGTKIVNNVFMNCYPAISLLDESLNSVIANNTIYKANFYALENNVVIDVDNHDDLCNGTVILNNVIYCDVNVGTAININGSNLMQDYNCIHGVGVEYSGAAVSGLHNIDSINRLGHTNPGFIGNNAELFIASPCVSSGATKTTYPQLPEFDFDGLLRPDVLPMSIGAYEPKIKTYFKKNSSIKLTEDTDDNRINSDMCAVVSPAGQKIIFYAKTFNSGRLSNSRVTYVLPFTLNVEAGNGLINGLTVNWLAASFIVSQNSFILVYVNTSGVVGLTSDFTMTFIKDVIVLAYVNVGGSEIVYVEEVEKTNKNIYCRKQILHSYGLWDWDDYEFILNTGSQPRALYDSLTGKIYMSYKKDGTAFTRIFDLNLENSFKYLPNKYIVSNVIYLSRNQESSAYFMGSFGTKTNSAIDNIDLFPLGSSALSFIYLSGSFKPFIFLPFITGEFVSNILYPYFIDIYTFDGSVYALENTVTFYDNINFLVDTRWYECLTNNQDRYIGVRVNSNLIAHQYETALENRIKVHVFVPFYEGDIVNGITAIEGRLSFLGSMGSKSGIEKTFEYQETRDFEFNNVNFLGSMGSKSEIEKTFEYQETRDFEFDDANFIGMFGSVTSIVGLDTAPMIDIHPADTSILSGEDIFLAVLAHGTTPLYYQWKKNTLNILGATSNVYVKSGAVPEDSGSYTCDVANAAGLVTSDIATVTVS